MDSHAPFWNDSRKLVTRRYLGVQFMGHGDAVKLVDCCHESFRGLHEKNIPLISVDGPSLTGNFMKMFVIIFSVMICPFNPYGWVVVDCTSFMTHLKMDECIRLGPKIFLLDPIPIYERFIWLERRLHRNNWFLFLPIKVLCSQMG